LKGLPATCPLVPCNGRRVALAQARQAGDISKKFHRVLQWSNMGDLHLRSPGSLRLVHLNTTYLTTSLKPYRWRLEKMGMTG
jgi:hypothetical protein